MDPIYVNSGSQHCGLKCLRLVLLLADRVEGYTSPLVTQPIYGGHRTDTQLSIRAALLENLTDDAIS